MGQAGLTCSPPPFFLASSRATSPLLVPERPWRYARLVQVSETQCPPLTAGFRGRGPKSPDGRGKYRAVMALSRMGAGYINRGRELAILGVASTSPAPRATRSGAASTRASRARYRLPQGLHGGAAFLSQPDSSVDIITFTVALQALAPSNRTQSHWAAREVRHNRPSRNWLSIAVFAVLSFVPSAVLPFVSPC